MYAAHGGELEKQGWDLGPLSEDSEGTGPGLSLGWVSRNSTGDWKVLPRLLQVVELSHRGVVRDTEALALCV